MLTITISLLAIATVVETSVNAMLISVCDDVLDHDHDLYLYLSDVVSRRELAGSFMSMHQPSLVFVFYSYQIREIFSFTYFTIELKVS